MKKQIALAMLLLSTASAMAQQKIGGTGAPNSGSILELVSPANPAGRGLLYPKVSLTTSLATWGLNGSATAGMVVYNLTTTAPFSEGLYMWANSQWNKINTSAATGNDKNIYEGDGTLTGLRTVTHAGFGLNFTGGVVSFNPKANASYMQIDPGHLLNNVRLYASDTLELQSGGNPYQFNLLPNGLVGINTNSPASRLDIRDTVNNILDIYSYTSAPLSQGATVRTFTAKGTRAAPAALQNGDGLGAYRFCGYDGTSFGFAKVAINALATENWTPTTTGASLQFVTTANGTNILAPRMTINHNGYVGIGVAAPATLLSNTTSIVGGSDGNGASNTTFSWAASGQGYPVMIHNTSTAAGSGGLAVRTFATDAGSRALDITSGTSSGFGTPLFVVGGNGNVGIGLVTASTTLDVNGSARIRSINSAGSGVATWPVVSDVNGNILKGNGTVNSTIVWTPTLTTAAPTADFAGLVDGAMYEVDVYNGDGCGLSITAKMYVKIGSYNLEYRIVPMFAASSDGGSPTLTRSTAAGTAEINTRAEYVDAASGCGDGSTAKHRDFIVQFNTGVSPWQFRFTATTTGPFTRNPTINFRRLN